MDNSRRDFLKASAMSIAGMALGSQLLGKEVFAKSHIQKIDQLGLILGTINNEMKEDWQQALEKVAEIGYKYVEGGMYGKSVKKYTKFLEKTGLQHISTGASLYPMSQDIDGFIQKALDINAKYLTSFWPWKVGRDNIDKDEIFRSIEIWHKIGEKAKAAGLKFAIHNHDIEFLDYDGEIGYDIILKNTDPELVTMELDLYWIVFAGFDPVEYFEKYPGRFELFHVKDMDNTEAKGIKCPGNGIIDFSKIFAKSEQAGVKHYIVENEKNKNGYQCIEDSYKHLTDLTF